MSEIKFDLDVRIAKKKLHKLKNINKATHYIMQKWTGRTVKKIIRNISGGSLNTKTGKLRRSIGGKVFPGEVVKAVIGTGVSGFRGPVKYARIHEEGGTIRPKRGQYLTIPFPGVKNPPGYYKARFDSFVIRSRKGSLLIVQRQGKKGFKPLFTLKEQVEMPARYWLSDSINEMTPELIRMMSVEEILRVLDRMYGRR